MEANLPDPVVGWIYKHAAKNIWRVAAWYELDDLIQDGLVVAYKCQDRYGVPGVDIDHPHFMSLVKTSFTNHVTDLVRRKLGFNDSVKIADLSTTRSEADVIDSLTKALPSQEFAVFITEMPKHLRQVVEQYLSDPRSLFKVRKRAYAPDQTLAERLESLTGFPQDLDFETEFLAYIFEQENGL